MKFFHFYEKSVTNELKLISSSTNPSLPTVTTTTTLDITNKDINTGLIYFRQFRLWSCYMCQNPDTYKLDITSTTIPLYSSLLHLWDPTVTLPYPTTVGITDLKGGIDMEPSTDSTWIGYNIIDYSNYYKLVSPTYLCVETDQSCTGLLKMNQIADVEFDVKPAV